MGNIVHMCVTPIVLFERIIYWHQQFQGFYSNHCIKLQGCVRKGAMDYKWREIKCFLRSYRWPCKDLLWKEGVKLLVKKITLERPVQRPEESLPIFIFAKTLWKKKSHNFSYLVIHANLLSYFFLFFKIRIWFGNFSASIDISDDYEYSFFPSLYQF